MQDWMIPQGNLRYSYRYTYRCTCQKMCTRSGVAMRCSPFMLCTREIQAYKRAEVRTRRAY
ncbi:hypothetical protein E2C01_016528 [Portunus trituberculatus]|uniref:Uncharacterized protein n=1 Tax=Portunus trituberculatus TaxID=210409 RepID=A0A5B7DPU6_PORTR|nr:hypothetical protein [Portunus trituberculatus]